MQLGKHLQLLLLMKKLLNKVLVLSLSTQTTRSIQSIRIQNKFYSGPIKVQTQQKSFHGQLGVMEKVHDLINYPQMICTIIYLLLVLYMIYNSVLELKWKYFVEFWSIIELSLIIRSISSVGIYFTRYKTAKELDKLFRKSQGDVYIDLEESVYLNDLLTYFYGFRCFFIYVDLTVVCLYSAKPFVHQ
ncbi:unnamed protein product [Adineta ricciae]|uniref:Polycystin cation channel PKD1/PKD2 domain-containing protein n=1 Tax=Adineta ricciae TaxID=249248 RepID=A0A814RAK7_ADIRI|nr:unnamed protein product [Adineta ricciae]